MRKWVHFFTTMTGSAARCTFTDSISSQHDCHMQCLNPAALEPGFHVKKHLCTPMQVTSLTLFIGGFRRSALRDHGFVLSDLTILSKGSACLPRVTGSLLHETQEGKGREAIGSTGACTHIHCLSWKVGAVNTVTFTFCSLLHV